MGYSRWVQMRANPVLQLSAKGSLVSLLHLLTINVTQLKQLRSQESLKEAAAASDMELLLLYRFQQTMDPCTSLHCKDKHSENLYLFAVCISRLFKVEEQRQDNTDDEGSGW